MLHSSSLPFHAGPPGARRSSKGAAPGRRALMNQWGAFLAGTEPKVVRLYGRSHGQPARGARSTHVRADHSAHWRNSSCGPQAMHTYWPQPWTDRLRFSANYYMTVASWSCFSSTRVIGWSTCNTEPRVPASSGGRALFLMLSTCPGWDRGDLSNLSSTPSMKRGVMLSLNPIRERVGFLSTKTRRSSSATQSFEQTSPTT